MLFVLNLHHFIQKVRFMFKLQTELLCCYTLLYMYKYTEYFIIKHVFFKYMHCFTHWHTYDQWLSFFIGDVFFFSLYQTVIKLCIDVKAFLENSLKNYRKFHEETPKSFPIQNKPKRFPCSLWFKELGISK